MRPKIGDGLHRITTAGASAVQPVKHARNLNRLPAFPVIPSTARSTRIRLLMIYRAEYLKPDGRRLWLYGRSPPKIAAPTSPGPKPTVLDVHLRRHPLLEEWVIYATHRQNRTFLPSPEDDPLAPTTDPHRPTELPAGDYEVAVFENRFPSLSIDCGPPPQIEGAETAPALGSCEVVVFAQDPSCSLGELPLDRICLVLEVWADRTRRLQEAGLSYVMPFENRGVEMGATLQHPHSQIYGYGFLPLRQARATKVLQEYHSRTGGNLFADLAVAELERNIRVIAARGSAVAFAPPFAQFPYETWVVPTRPVPDLAGLGHAERQDMAFALSQSLRRLDRLWDRPMPYLMMVNQTPTEALAHPEWTVHIQIQPLRRAPDKLKFLAGTELGAGVFANDVTPEAAAAALRDIGL
jgi:UDPglucose--hexose-1-phosphate uridylyltransferase